MGDDEVRTTERQVQVGWTRLGFCNNPVAGWLHRECVGHQTGLQVEMVMEMEMEMSARAGS